MKLPDIEEVSAAVHASWMETNWDQGVTSRKAEDGEELMVPYRDLSEKAKDLDRGTVRAVYAAIIATECRLRRAASLEKIAAKELRKSLKSQRAE